MKKYLTFIFLLSYFFIQAQVVETTRIIGGIIGSRPKADIEKQIFVGLNGYYPIGISNLLGGDLIIPPITLSGEYGVYKNISLGLFIGKSVTESKNFNIGGLSPYDLLNVINQTLCDTDPNLASALGINCSMEAANGSSYKNRINYTLLGLSGKYHFVGNERLMWNIGLKGGYKFSKNKQIGLNTDNPIIDEVTNFLDETSKFFFSSTIGCNYFLTNKKKWSIQPEAGYGFGWGDGISLGTKSLLLGIGVNYHLNNNNKKADIKN